MCFDEKTSLGVFSIGLTSSIILLRNGIANKNKSDILFSCITFLISLMQLNEYFLWRNQKCNIKNKFWSIMILFVLYLQPIISILLLKKLYNSNIFLQNNILYFFMIMYTIITVYFIYFLSKTNVCSKPQNSKRLEWNALTKLFDNKTILFLFWLGFYGFFLFFCYLIFFFKNNKNIQLKDIVGNYPLRLLFIPISFLYVILTQTKNYNIFRPDIYGSLWCFISVFIGPISLTYL